MSQNQNRMINQFLQGKSSTVNDLINSNKNPLNNRLFFSKELTNKKTKLISPHFEQSNDNYYNCKNSLTNSYNDTNNKNCKNYYKIHSHNHSEYITNNTKDFFLTNTNQDLIKTPESKKKSIHCVYHCKTEENLIKRNNSSNYNVKTKIEAKKKTEEKKYNTVIQERRSYPFKQLSPSIPILFKDKYILTKSKEKNDNSFFKKKDYSEKTYYKNNDQNKSNKNSTDYNNLSHSINFKDIENSRKPIKNCKGSYIIRNKRYSFVENLFNGIKSNNINNKDKDNCKFHSITDKKINKIDQEELRNEYKKFYYNNNNNNRNNLNRNNGNILSDKKSSSAKKVINKSTNRNLFIKINDNNKENELKKKYQNHSVLESINIKKIEKKESPKKKDNNNVNVHLDSNKINNRKNSTTINYNTNIKKQIHFDNKKLRKNFINNKKVFRYINNVNDSKKASVVINSSKVHNKRGINDSSYNNSLNSSDNFKENKSINIGDNNKITYIYEGKNKKQNSLSFNLNNSLLEKEKENNNKSDNTNNKNDNLKLNLENIIKRIIKKRNKRQRIKKIILNENTIINTNTIEEIIKRSTIKNHNKTETDIIEKKERNLNSNHKIEKNQFTINQTINQKKSDIIPTINKKNDEIKVCKVNDMTFLGEQNNGNNSNIIIIINKRDKNKSKKINKSPKMNSGDNNEIINNIKITNIDNDNKNEKENIDNNISINTENNNVNDNRNINNNNINNQNNDNNSNSNVNNNNLNNTIKNKKINEKESDEKTKYINIKNDVINIKNINLNSNDDVKIDNFESDNNFINKINVDVKTDKNDSNMINYNENEIYITEDNNKNKNEINQDKVIINENNNGEIKENIQNNCKTNNIAEKEINTDNNGKNTFSNIINNIIIHSKDTINNNNEKIISEDNINNKIPEDIRNNKDNNTVDNKIINNDNKDFNKKDDYDNIQEDTTANNDNIINISFNKDEENDKTEKINSSNINQIQNSKPTTSLINNLISEKENQEESERINIEDNSKNKIFIKIENNFDNNNCNNVENNDKLSLNKEEKKTDQNTEASIFNRYKHFLKKKNSDDYLSKSPNASIEKKPDFNSNDFSIEEIQNNMAVTQHNVQRKRPVFTLPSFKKRCISQGKPFNLIQKYYDENFILEDDKEEEFKKYIKYNGDSRSNSQDNSLNSKHSLCNSNKKSFRKIDDIEENNENININNIRREKERMSFRRITEEFFNDLEDEE